MDRHKDRDSSTLPTPVDYAGVHRVDAVCQTCGHCSVLDLPALVMVTCRSSIYRCDAPNAGGGGTA